VLGSWRGMVTGGNRCETAPSIERESAITRLTYDVVFLFALIRPVCALQITGYGRKVPNDKAHYHDCAQARTRRIESSEGGFSSVGLVALN
jgi:hypothetical protein